MKPTPLATDLKEALKASKKSFIAAGVFSLFINLLMLTSPLYMLQVYDRVVTSRSTETLFFLTLIMVFLFGLMGLLEWVRSRLLVRVGNELQDKLSTRIYSAMFEQGVKTPTKRSPQSLSDMTTLRQFMTGNGLFAFFDAPWLPIYIGILFMFHPAFGFFSIGAAVILLIVAILNERSTKKALQEANTLNMHAQNLAGSNLNNTEVLHAMGMLPGIRGRWYKKHQLFLGKQTEASDKAGIYSNLSKVLRMVFQSLILGLGAWYVVQNEMSPGMMIAGSILMGRALAPLDLIINSWGGFNSARSAYGRLNELLTDFPATQEHMSLPDPKGEVKVEGLVVYPPGSQTPALRNVNMHLPAGQHLAIVGPSAAGKSTLSRAVLGLWPAAGGVVRIDGAQIEHYNRDELGPHLGYLPQDIELFDGTVAENIARFGEVDPNQVVIAAKKAGVHELILKLSNGYDTHIGSTQGALSGGQRQRVGLARALYGTPKVIVLDEPNSNLDEQGEQALAAAMIQLKEEQTTVILVSHRPALLRHVDQIMVMREGTVHMYGERDEVLKTLAQQNLAQQPPAQKS